MANQPSLIPFAWAANNSTTETIPATTTESGKASWDQGFPVETSLPLSQGGIPPKYGDFNGVLNVLSQFALFAQSGGQYAWVNSLDYSVGSIVLGTDGSIYRAAQVSGPSTAAVNPVGDTSGKWERIVSKSDIDALEEDIQDAMDTASDAVSNASAAQSAVTTLDANVVKLSGAQTISGNKTFTDRIIAKTGDFIVRDVDDSYLRINGGTASTKGGSVLMYGKDSSICPGWVVIQANDGSNSTNLDITPTGSLMWGGKNFVYDSGNQQIAGVKNFTDNPKITRASNTFLDMINTSAVKGTAGGSNISYGLACYDKNNTQLGTLGYWYTTSKDSYFQIRAFNATSSSATDHADLYVGYGAVSGRHIRPEGNGVTDLGLASYRWNRVYAANGTIQTSDERLKSAITDVPDAVLDAWGDVQWTQFQFKDAVAQKGVDKARLHNGLIAQRIDAVFKAHGLDASRYGLFCYDAWDATQEQKDENGVVRIEASPAGEQYSLRYEEALAMEAAYQRRRADRAEARISALEQRLGELEAVLASLIAPISDEQTAEPEQEGEGADA